MKACFFAFLLFFGSTMISRAAAASEFDSVFQSLLDKKQVSYRLLEDGRYELQTDSGVRTVSTDNIKKNFARDKDAEAVARFLETVLTIEQSMPGWDKAKAHLFPLLVSAELELGKGAVARTVSDKTLMVLVYHVEGSGEIRFVQAGDLDEWRISAAVAWETALEQLNERALKTDVTMLAADGVNLASIYAEEPYKASLLLAPGLKQRLPASMGWPVIAVAPARDFVYLLPKSEFEKAPGLGAVVVKEFKESGYPISTEVWELSDAGMTAIGEYPVE